MEGGGGGVKNNDSRSTTQFEVQCNFKYNGFFFSYEIIVASNEKKMIFEDTIHVALGGVYLLVVVEIGGSIEVSKGVWISILTF